MNIFSLLPPYLVILAIILVILPTILGIIARFFLYRHLVDSARNTRYLLEGRYIDRKPSIVKKIEQRFDTFDNSIEEINTAAIVAGRYSQEECSILGLPFNCEKTAYFTRILPNLLLSFGLLGTFLGITINLTNLSQTITQVDITDVRSLVEELNQPLQGMGIAFVTSLVAIACSSFLTVINLFWNTNTAKASLLNFLEDYADNFCLSQLKTVNPLEAAIDRFSHNCDRMLNHLGSSIEDAITRAFSKIEDSADTFERAASKLDDSRLPEQLSNATTDLAIAQNKFSQSSLVLQRSTQSFEHSLEAINKVMRHLAILNRDKNQLEQTNLQNIQQQLEELVKITDRNYHTRNGE